MIPVLFSLFIIIALGTVLYVYLREEQNRAIPPKDKYDEAWNQSYKNIQPSRHTLKSFILQNLFFAFLFTFVLFPIFTVFLVSIINSTNTTNTGVLSLGLPTLILISLPILLIVVFLLSTTGINRQTSPLIYFAVVIVLFISIIGCLGYCVSILPTLDLSGLN